MKENPQWDTREIFFVCYLLIVVSVGFCAIHYAYGQEVYDNVREKEAGNGTLENFRDISIEIVEIGENKDWNENGLLDQSVISGYINISGVKSWENKGWDKVCKDLESKRELFQILTNENRNTIKILGAQMSVESLKNIIPTYLHKIPFNLHVYVDIRHTCEKSRSGDEDVMVVEWIEALWRRIGEGEEQKLRWHINTKLLPIGEELKELETIEIELKTAKDPKRIIELEELKRKLKEEVKEGLLDHRIEIPSHMLPYLEPGDTLGIQIIARFEHDGEVKMIETETFLYVMYDMNVYVDAIQAAAQELDNSISLPQAF